MPRQDTIVLNKKLNDLRKSAKADKKRVKEEEDGEDTHTQPILKQVRNMKPKAAKTTSRQIAASPTSTFNNLSATLFGTGSQFWGGDNRESPLKQSFSYLKALVRRRARYKPKISRLEVNNKDGLFFLDIEKLVFL